MRRDNRSGRTNLHLERGTDLWCAEIRILRDGQRVRIRKRSKDRQTLERWLDEQEAALGLGV